MKHFAPALFVVLFIHAVLSHGGGRKDALTIRQGYELNYKSMALPFGKHHGTLPAERSFLQVKSDNFIASAMKKAEDDQALILRFYERTGKQGNVTFLLPPGAESAREMNLRERPIEDLPVTNSELTVPKPYEIKTVEIRFAEVPTAGESAQQ